MKNMMLAFIQAEKGRCARRKIGCVIADKELNVISVGENGPPISIDNGVVCSCPGKDIPAGTGGANGIASCYGVHAEERALLGINPKDVYACFSTKAPCVPCTLKLLETDCQYIYFAVDSNDKTNKELWEKAGRKWVQVSD